MSRCKCFPPPAPESTVIRQYLEVDYPKLVRLYGDLWRRLEGVTVDMRTATPDLSMAATSTDEDDLDPSDRKTQSFE